MITHWETTRDAGITYATGFTAASVRCGLKSNGPDIALVVSQCDATCAGTFTVNQVKASCVHHSSRVVESGTARAIICNAGNANACNGPAGARDTQRCADLVAHATSIPAHSVLVASTGIIGHPLQMDKMESGIAEAASALGRSREVDLKVAKAIMTTDTRPKQIAASVESTAWSGVLRIGAVCKGSGMISPNMATMLAFITSDAAVPQPDLRAALSIAVQRTFNRITVDGDTSTNDMTLLLANGSGGAAVKSASAVADFTEALHRVCLALAIEVARDGEGATKLVEVTVTGARTEAEAATVARTVADSPLVKTALFGCDPNWGRILMAAGRAGVELNQDTVRVCIGETPVYELGQGTSFDSHACHNYLRKDSIAIGIDLGAGQSQATVYTCDLSYDYVKINAEYHT